MLNQANRVLPSVPCRCAPKIRAAGARMLSAMHLLALVCR